MDLREAYSAAIAQIVEQYGRLHFPWIGVSKNRFIVFVGSSLICLKLPADEKAHDTYFDPAVLSRC